MPDDDKRTFTEGEAYALVADAVSRETAAANAEVEALKATNATLSTERDAMEVRATAAETAKVAAEQALTDFKAQIETEKANEAKRSERVAELAKVAPKLEVTQERSDRIVAMEDSAFTDYLEQLRQVAGEVKPDDKGGDGKPLPRESAAFGGGAGAGGGGTKTGSVKQMFGASRVLSTKSA